MRVRDNRGQGAEVRPTHGSWREHSDRDLIAAMRANVSPAFDEFVARYQPLLLARAGRFGLPAWQREEYVIEVLESTILRFVKPGIQPPAEMAAYLTRTLSNRLLDAVRAHGARTRHEQAAADRTAPAYEQAVTSLASQDALEGSAVFRDASASDPPPGIAQLAAALIHQMSEEEHNLISWESNMIPHRTIALWLGISHAAATKRIWRLRARLREIAARHARTLSPAEQDDIDRFMHRLGRPAPQAANSRAMVAEGASSPYRTAEAMEASTTIEEEIDE